MTFMNALALAVCLLSFFLLWGIFWRGQADWRSGFVLAATAWALALVAITEVLSLFRSLTFAAVLAAWSLCSLLALAAWLRYVGDPRTLLRGIGAEHLTTADRWLLVAGALIAATLGLIAWFSPPNTYDSLTYHMPRVMHWIQNRSVAFFPTHILRQLYSNPGSEFIILHLMILTGFDHLANFVQWFSMVGSAIGVSLVARELGVGLRGQVLSALAALSLPIGILQATSTQTDYVAGFWLAAFAYCMLSLRSRGGLWTGLACGASLGLALLAKSTAYIYAFPLLVWFAFASLRTQRVKAVLPLAAAALLVVLVNLGTYARDMQLFGNPLGFTQEPTVSSVYSNETFSAASLASNVLRNAALHMDTPFPAANSRLTGFVVGLHRYIGISPNDPRTTWPGTDFAVEPMAFSEDADGNPIHFALILICGVFICLRRELRRRMLAYLLCLLAAYLLFCLVLKWQPWNSRLHLPLFLLSAPLLGAATDTRRFRWLPGVLAAVLLLASLPWVLLNRSRPLIGPNSVVTASRLQRDSETMANYTGAVRFLAKQTGGQCSRIGLYIGPSDLEYPFWVIVRSSFAPTVIVEEVAVDNISAREYESFPILAPCGIFATRPVPEGGLRVDGKAYHSGRVFGVISVLLPEK